MTLRPVCTFFHLLIIGKIFPKITADMLHHAPVSALVTVICKMMLLVPVITITMLSLTAIMVKYNVLIYIALGMAVMNINVFYLINDILEREAMEQSRK